MLVEDWADIIRASLLAGRCGSCPLWDARQRTRSLLMIYSFPAWRFSGQVPPASDFARAFVAHSGSMIHSLCQAAAGHDALICLQGMALLPSSLEPLSGYLLFILIFLLGYQQWRLYRFRQEAAKREELFRIVAENAADMIALVDVKGRRLYNSPAYERILGYSTEELAKTPALDQVHPEDRFRVLEAAREARRTGAGKRLHYRIRHKDGSWRVLESTASAIRNAEGEVEKLVIVNRDITERQRSEEKLEHDSFRDPLTGLPNRLLFLNRLQHCFARAQRDPGYRYAVLLLDLDGFRVLTEAMDADAGDQVIVEVARRVEACLRDKDTVARPTTTLPTNDTLLPRSGGDELAVLLDAIADPVEAMRTARRIQTAVGKPITVRGRILELSTSIGIALNAAGLQRSEGLLEDADRALHRAKALGGSRCEVYDEGMHIRAVNQLKLESELRTAIDCGQFPLCYQPIISLASKQVVGFEALVRWRHPEQGLVPPSKFIEAAEDIGLTISIGKQVIRQACTQLRVWQHAFRCPLTITVNLSAKQFAHADLVTDVRAAVQESHIDPSRLQLEITENVIMADPGQAVDLLTQLKHIGIGISVGDFGIGQSSLSWLRRFPIDELKVDRSLVSSMLTDRVSCEIAGLIVTVGGSLKLKVVAEGIETAGQLERLGKLGCTLGQGYFFSPPVEPERAEQLLREQNLRKAIGAG